LNSSTQPTTSAMRLREAQTEVSKREVEEGIHRKEQIKFFSPNSRKHHPTAKDQKQSIKGLRETQIQVSKTKVIEGTPRKE